MSQKFAITTFLLQNFAILKYDVFLSQKFANARSALALKDIWRSPLARQLIAGWTHHHYHQHGHPHHHGAGREP